ncbi:hypothetical protein DE146DRAFT_406915 [Phaeosphaeria sp. MPI-PUGE-AT-0046c]|nr:hypothetical protein DE146DRAFT_406915 [Phaeosphaeria sp. MPI-PUGE-AT-0046c]
MSSNLHEASSGFPIRRAAVARRAEKRHVESNCMPSTAHAAISGSCVDKARDVPRGIDLVDQIQESVRAGQLRATPCIASSIVMPQWRFDVAMEVRCLGGFELFRRRCGRGHLVDTYRWPPHTPLPPATTTARDRARVGATVHMDLQQATAQCVLYEMRRGMNGCVGRFRGTGVRSGRRVSERALLTSREGASSRHRLPTSTKAPRCIE